MKSQPCAIITGGSRGIGAAIARSFEGAGYRVAVTSRSGVLPKGGGASIKAWKVDVCDTSAFAAVCVDVFSWGGRIDVLVNNVGLSSWRPLEAIDEVFWTNMIDANLKSVLFCTKAVVPHMVNGGSVINVSSLAGKRGSTNNSVYCAAKFGVNGITQSLAKELGGRGIRVNAVCPVYVDTDSLQDALKSPAAPPAGKSVASFLREFAFSNSALQRLPAASEIGSTCVFLASPAASAVTGQSLNVDCGVMPQ
jgi:NAD(P)-dependent dehydrogenase (short-subunit alcohol dehydrogenase family)